VECLIKVYINFTCEFDRGHGLLIRRTWVVAAGRNFTFKIAAKPLQMET